MDRDRLIAAFKKKGYEVSFFAGREEARTYLGGLFCGSTIGFGDSLTLAELKLYDLLREDNTVFDPNQCADNESFLATARQALLAAGNRARRRAVPPPAFPIQPFSHP